MRQRSIGCEPVLFSTVSLAASLRITGRSIKSGRHGRNPARDETFGRRRGRSDSNISVATRQREEFVARRDLDDDAGLLDAECRQNRSHETRAAYRWW